MAKDDPTGVDGGSSIPGSTAEGELGHGSMRSHPRWGTLKVSFGLLVAFVIGVGIGATATSGSDGETTAGVVAESDTTRPGLPANSSVSTTTTTTTTTVPPMGTRDNPLPVGEPIRGGEWILTILAYESDVNVAAFNQFNDPPPPGSVHVRVRFRAVFDGVGTGSPTDITVNLAAQNGSTYGPVGVAGGSAGDPQNLYLQPNTFPGGSIEGYVYYALPSPQASEQLIGFQPNVSYTDVPGGVRFFRVN